MRHPEESRTWIAPGRDFRHPFYHPRGGQLQMQNREQDLENFNLCNFLMFVIFTINIVKNLKKRIRRNTLKTNRSCGPQEAGRMGS